MKVIYLLILSLLIMNHTSAQTRNDVKLYGYKQPVVSGVSPTISADETGRAVSSYKPRYNYFIYLSAPANLRAIPTEIWIKGQQYSVTATPVETPVEYKNPTTMPGYDKSITLVPKTTNKVYQLQYSSAPVMKNLAAAEKQARSNDIVVAYKMGGKFYYATLKSLTDLEPVAMQ